nr:hypothetical protein [Tanacetum cinerariifolium]
MKAVSDKLASVQSIVATNSQHVQDLRLMFKDMVFLLEAADVFKKANAEGEKWEKNNLETLNKEKDAQHPNQTQGEQHSGDTTMANAQGEKPPAQELSDLEQAPPINEESALVLYGSVEKSSEENISEKNVSDDEPSVYSALAEGLLDGILNKLRKSIFRASDRRPGKFDLRASTTIKDSGVSKPVRKTRSSSGMERSPDSDSESPRIFDLV